MPRGAWSCSAIRRSARTQRLSGRYKIGIDTGAVEGGPLTCVILESEGNTPPVFVQQGYIVVGKDKRANG